MGEDNCNNITYSVTDNPKFYIKDEYGNLKEFGKFASIDADLVTCGEGSNFFDDEEAKHIRTITSDCSTFKCDINNIDLSFIWDDSWAEHKKCVQIAELKQHLYLEKKNGNLLSAVVLEGLNRGLITVDEALYFVSNGWKRMHGFSATRFEGIKKSKKKEYNDYPKKSVKQDMICNIFNQKLSYLCQFMYNNQIVIYKPDYLNDCVNMRNKNDNDNDMTFDEFSDGIIKGFEKLW